MKRFQSSKPGVPRVRKVMTQQEKENFYVDPKELLKEIKSYKSTDKMSNELGIILVKIAKKFATKPCFSGYTYKDDFIGDAVARMVEQAHKIRLDIPNSNPFSYLTQICYNCFISKINKEKKLSTIKERLALDCIESLESEEHLYIKKNIESQETGDTSGESYST